MQAGEEIEMSFHYTIVSTEDIPLGEVITSDSLTFEDFYEDAGEDILPDEIAALIGRIAVESIPKGTPVSQEMLEADSIDPNSLDFLTPEIKMMIVYSHPMIRAFENGSLPFCEPLAESGLIKTFDVRPDLCHLATKAYEASFNYAEGMKNKVISEINKSGDVGMSKNDIVQFLNREEPGVDSKIVNEFADRLIYVLTRQPGIGLAHVHHDCMRLMTK